MSSTQERRQKYDYRTEYFKHNPGLFGRIYFCSQCGRPLTKDEVEVDHIIALSRMGVNHVINCVACCRHCNRSKGDKLDYRILKGIFAKILEEISIFIPFIFKSTGRVITSLFGERIKHHLFKMEFIVLILIILMLFYIL